MAAPVTQAAVEKGFKRAVAAGFRRLLRHWPVYSSLNLPLKELRSMPTRRTEPATPRERMRFLIGGRQRLRSGGLHAERGRDSFVPRWNWRPAIRRLTWRWSRAFNGPDRDMHSARAANR